MESIHVSVLRANLVDFRDGVLESVDAIIKAIDTKILVGNIHVPVEKKVRKKRTRKVKVVEFAPPKEEPSLPDAKKIKSGRRTKKEMELAPPRSQPQMDLEKEYQAWTTRTPESS